MVDRQVFSVQEFEEFIKDDNVAEKCKARDGLWGFTLWNDDLFPLGMADIKQIKSNTPSSYDLSKISQAKRFTNSCNVQVGLNLNTFIQFKMGSFHLLHNRR